MAQAPVLGIGMGFRRQDTDGRLVVTNVKAGGPAERAGVVGGDIICTYSGENLALKPGAYLNEMLAHNTDPIVRFGMRRGNNPNINSVVVIRTLLSVPDEDQSVPAAIAGSPHAQAAENERQIARTVSGAAPGLGGGAGMYSSPGASHGVRGVANSNVLYDSEQSDCYTSGSTSHGSLSDYSREGYSSDDGLGRNQPSPQTIVRKEPFENTLSGGTSPEPSPRSRPTPLSPLRYERYGESRKASAAARSSHELFPPSARGSCWARKSNAKGESEASNAELNVHSSMERRDQPAPSEIMAQLEQLKDYVDQRLSGMEAHIAVNAHEWPADHSNGAPSPQKAFRYQGILARDAEAKRKEAEDQRVLEELVRKQVVQRMQDTEQTRVEAEVKREELMTALKALMQRVREEELERAQMDALRQKMEEERNHKMDEMRRELTAMSDVTDRMLEGYSEVKPMIAASMERMEAIVKKSEHEMLLELNTLRSQVFEAIMRDLSKPVVISNSTPATYVSPRQTSMERIDEGQESEFLDSPRNVLNIRNVAAE